MTDLEKMLKEAQTKRAEVEAEIVVLAKSFLADENTKEIHRFAMQSYIESKFGDMDKELVDLAWNTVESFKKEIKPVEVKSNKKEFLVKASKVSNNDVKKKAETLGRTIDLDTLAEVSSYIGKLFDFTKAAKMEKVALETNELEEALAGEVSQFVGEVIIDNKIQNGNLVTTEPENLKKAVEEIKAKYPTLDYKVYEILEDNNAHTENQLLSLAGSFGDQGYVESAVQELYSGIQGQASIEPKADTYANEVLTAKLSDKVAIEAIKKAKSIKDKVALNYIAMYNIKDVNEQMKVKAIVTLINPELQIKAVVKIKDVKKASKNFHSLKKNAKNNAKKSILKKADNAELDSIVDAFGKEFSEEIKASFKDDKDKGTFKADGLTYKWYKDEEVAEKVAKEDVVEMLKDEPELFTQSWLSNYLTISDTDRRVMATEEVDSLLGEGLITEDEQSDKYDELYEAYEDPVKYFVEEQGIYTLEELMKASFISIDINEAADDAISMDGFAHFISQYDSGYDTTSEGVVIIGVDSASEIDKGSAETPKESAVQACSCGNKECKGECKKAETKCACGKEGCDGKCKEKEATVASERTEVTADEEENKATDPKYKSKRLKTSPRGNDVPAGPHVPVPEDMKAQVSAFIQNGDELNLIETKLAEIKASLDRLAKEQQVESGYTDKVAAFEEKAIALGEKLVAINQKKVSYGDKLITVVQHPSKVIAPSFEEIVEVITGVFEDEDYILEAIDKISKLSPAMTEVVLHNKPKNASVDGDVNKQAEEGDENIDAMLNEYESWLNKAYEAVRALYAKITNADEQLNSELGSEDLAMAASKVAAEGKEENEWVKLQKEFAQEVLNTMVASLTDIEIPNGYKFSFDKSRNISVEIGENAIPTEKEISGMVVNEISPIINEYTDRAIMEGLENCNSDMWMLATKEVASMIEKGEVKEEDMEDEESKEFSDIENSFITQAQYDYSWMPNQKVIITQNGQEVAKENWTSNMWGGGGFGLNSSKLPEKTLKLAKFRNKRAARIKSVEKK